VELEEVQLELSVEPAVRAVRAVPEALLMVEELLD
jgi:hypothetical protein